MTDIEELRFGMNEGARQFRSNEHLLEACGDGDAHAKLTSFHDRFFARFDEEHALDTYVLCTARHEPSDNDGVLSMWRGYGSNGGGIAIVFDTAELTPSEASPFIVGRVDYRSHASRLDWLASKLKVLAKAVSASDKSDDALASAAFAWLESLKLFALFTKHDGFIEEHEWRIVYMRERDTAGVADSMLGYHITDRGVETKLKLKFSELAKTFGSDLSLEKLVDRIILGPSISSVLSENSLRRMLRIEGRHDLAALVMASSIPYRPRGSAA
jgi:hypothetical protein